jgi:hypothetical protein
MKININTLLALLGGLGVFAPDLAFIAQWLTGLGVGWLAYVARVIGVLAVLFAAAPRIVPRLRGVLSVVGLATAPGEVAPSAGTVGAVPSSEAPTVPTLVSTPKETTK